MPKLLIDSAPLLAATRKVQAALDDIKDARERKVMLDEESRRWWETHDPRNEEHVRLISGREDQARLLPRFTEIAENKMNENLVPALYEALESARRDYQGKLAAQRERALDALEKLIKPYNADSTDPLNGAVTNVARAKAASFGVMMRFTDQWAPDADNYHSRADKAAYLVELARTALALIDSINAAGGFLTPEHAHLCK